MTESLAILLEHDVEITLRDGIATRADIWRPATGRAVPVVLVRTPYDKETPQHLSPVEPRRALERGYAFVIQDVRGKGKSGGTFEPFVQERDDGYDSVRWLAEQDWCDGRVVMLGASYVGATQWLAAATAPPPLRAIAPLVSADGYGEGWGFRSGVREAGFLGTWIATALAPDDQLWLDNPSRAFDDQAGVVSLAWWARDWFHEPAGSAYWASRSVTHQRHEIDIPVLHVGGWYDCFLAGTLRSFANQRRPADRLIIGPWGHDHAFEHVIAERDLGWAGNGAAFGVGERVLDFYDAALAGQEPDLPPVSAYLLGARRWESLSDWPPADTREIRVPLAGGILDVDPTALPPTLGGRGLFILVPFYGYGPRDQRPVAARDDVLLLPLDVPGAHTVLAGRVRANLRVASSGGATRDWTAMLCVREAGGALINLCEGIVRVPTEASSVEIDLGDVFVEIQPGDRLAVLIAGGSYPRWEPPADPGRQQVLAGSELVLQART